MKPPLVRVRWLVGSVFLASGFYCRFARQHGRPHQSCHTIVQVAPANSGLRKQAEDSQRAAGNSHSLDLSG
jgi:hypothetical protein